MSDTDSTAIQLLGMFARRAGAIFGIYAVGYLGFSPAWLIGGVILSVMREKWRREKATKREVNRTMALSSEQLTLAKLQDLPSWVHFPDVERAEWLNKMLKQMWPFVGDYVKDLLKTQWEESLRNTMAGYKLNNFKFEKIFLGDIPPRVGGVKVYTDNIQRSEIIMDLEIFYAGDCRIECSFSRMSAGIKDFTLHGVMRIVYKPLIKTMPLIGGMQVFFLNNPDIDFNMLGVADVLDMPGLSGILRNVILDTIGAMMVLPNKWPIVLSDQIPTKLVTASQPKGVLRVRLIEGRDLMKKDRNVFGQGRSDPYALIYIGSKQFKTKYIQDTVDPVWNYVCEFALLESVGPRLWLEFFDADDPGNKDDKLGRQTVESPLDDVLGMRLIVDVNDHDMGPGDDDDLGRCSLDVAEVVNAGSQDIWVPLEQARSGRIHLKLDWLNLSTDVANIKEQLNEIEDLSAFSHSGLHSSVLTVFVDSATKLPMASRAAAEPNPLVRMVLGNAKEATGCKYRTLDPVWEEGFSFPVSNPLTQTLTLEVIDSTTERRLGHLQIEVKDLLREPQLEVHETPFQLKDSGPISKIILSMQLRILTHDKVTTAADPDAKLPSAVREAPLAPTAGDGAGDVAPTPLVRPTAVHPEQQTGQPGEPETVPVETREQVESLLQGLSSEAGLRQRKPENPAGKYRLGRVELTLRYSETRSALIIVVHKISSLPMQGDDIPDPYVKTYLLPDRTEDNKRKTRMIKDQCDPVYDETLEYSGRLNEIRIRRLELQVVSKKTFARNPILGMMHIDMRELDLENGVTRWFDMEPEDRFDS